MCPDQQLLSIYLDGELPSPWKEKLQEHFSQCSRCREKLENFKRLKELFKKETTIKRTFVERVIDEPTEPRTYTEQELLESKERVWKKIEAKQRFSASSNVWKRRLAVPLPAAAAAAVIIAFLTAFWLGGIGRSGKQTDTERANFTLAAEMDNIEEITGIIPTADMNGVLQYLAPDGTNIIILQLPESQSFSRTGEPAIIRAADFSRRQIEPSHGNGHQSRRRNQ